VLHVAASGTELARWLRRGRASAAVIRPDRTVMQAGKDIGALCHNVPTFQFASSQDELAGRESPR
jgi:3-(3-hydroxy-phenyl)propionate hydroxylase